MSIILNGTTGITTPTETATTSVTTPLLTSPASTALTIQSAGTTAMTVDTSQNVGIGTTSPNSLFKVDVTGKLRATTGLVVTGGNSLQLIESSGNNSWYFNNLSNSLTFTYNSTEAMRIDNSGNLLVGTTSATLSSFPTKLLSQADANTAWAFGLNNAAAGAGSIGFVTFNRNGTQTGTISNTGTATAYNTASDYRLKVNVAPMTGGLATVSALKPVTYDWVSDKSAGEGFIAHELQSVIPLAVTGKKDAVDDEGNIKPQGVDYSKIVVHLVAAIQELSAENDALEAANTAFEARLAALEAK